jgi:hypothetical protein
MKRASLLLLGLFAFAVTLPVWADFLDSYKQGIKAADDGDWTTVARLMEEAVAEQPEESPRIGKRFYFRRYVPHYYLGRARFEQGDCPGALAAWKTSEGQGVIQKFPEFQEIQQKRQICRQRAADRAAARQETVDAVARAQKAARSVDGLPGPELAPFWDRGEPSLARRTSEARRNLVSAEERLKNLGDSPAEAEEIRKLAERAALGFEGIHRESEQLKTRLAAERAEAVDDLAPLQREATRALASVRDLRPYPRELGRAVERLEALLAASRGADSGGSTASIARLRENLQAATGRLEAASARPPRELVAAAEAFFTGAYEEVLTLLQDTSFRSSKAAAHAHLFQAAAAYSLYILGARMEPELLDEARRHVLACRAQDRLRLPTRSAFSPRFIDFFLSQEETEDPPPALEEP